MESFPRFTPVFKRIGEAHLPRVYINHRDALPKAKKGGVYNCLYAKDHTQLWFGKWCSDRAKAYSAIISLEHSLVGTSS